MPAPEHSTDLYQAVVEHATTRSAKTALRCGAVTLSYQDLLREVDRAEPVPDWTVLDDSDKPSFVIRYLAAVKTGTPVVIGEPGTTTESVVRTLRRHPATRATEVMFTSGSSAGAKAVLLDGTAMYRKALHINKFLGATESVTELVTLPLRHSFGLGRLRAALAYGQTVVLPETAWTPDVLLRAAERHAPAGLALISSTVKLMLNRYAATLERTGPHISQLEIGSEPLDAEHRARLTRLLPDTRIAMHYGMTESSRTAMIDLHAPQGERPSAGHALPDVEIGVRTDHGVEAVGAGEICVRGPATLRAYVRDDQIVPLGPDEWFSTGDLGELGHDGGLVVTGRLSNVLKILGKKVSLEDTERAIRSHAPELDCVCVPRELLPGVLVMVALVESDSFGQDDRSRLFSHLERHLPAHQLPRDITAVARLPRLANGKVDRQGAAELVVRR